MDDLDKKILKHAGSITGRCRFVERRNIDCDSFSICENCGWNPEVETKRKAKTRRKIGVKPREKWYLGSGVYKKCP